MPRIADSYTLSMFPRKTLLQAHLESALFPSVCLDFLNVANEAIDLAQVDEWDTVLTLPNNKQLPVWKIIEGLHLEDFLEGENNEIVL